MLRLNFNEQENLRDESLETTFRNREWNLKFPDCKSRVITTATRQWLGPGPWTVYIHKRMLVEMKKIFILNEYRCQDTDSSQSVLSL